MRAVLTVPLLSLLMMSCAQPSPQPVLVRAEPPRALLQPCPVPPYPDQTPTHRQLMALILDLLASLDGCNADKAALREITRAPDE